MPPLLFDDTMLAAAAANANMLVPWYLMAAYAYYVQSDPILSDTAYDQIALRLLSVFDGVEHVHKSYISKAQLSAATFSELEKDYPRRVAGAIRALREGA